MTDEEYYREFHWVVHCGFICGLVHPIEWIVNAHRTPGGTLTPEYYEKMNEITGRYLCEMYEAMNAPMPATLDNVIKWCNDYYPEEHFISNLGESFRPHISEFLESKESLTK